MKYKIFISGVQNELKTERHAVKDLIIENHLLKDYFSVFLFEDVPAKSKSSKQIYLDEVIKSDIYLGLIGSKYGSTDTKGISATESEFLMAKKSGKNIFIYIKGKNNTQRDKKVQKFIQKIKNSERGYTYKRFATIPELKDEVYNSLVDFLKDEGIAGKTIFGESICKEASLKDIDVAKIKRVLETANIKRSYPIKPDVAIKNILVHLNLIKKGKLNNSAILLFAKNPQKFYRQAKIKCIQFPGIEIEKPFLSYHIFEGNLFDQIDKAVAFVLGTIKIPVIQRENSVQVSRLPEIPIFVIHEAIVNAVAHRDYNSSASVQVMVFTDRIEIWNPGKLPPQLSIKKLKRPHTSYPNNPIIADVMYLADYIQEAGSGIIEMIKQCKTMGLPEPEYIEDANEFHTIIYRDIWIKNYLLQLGLNEHQLKAIKYIKENGKITNKEYQNITGLKKRQSSDDLKILELKKVLIRIGKTGRGVYYILKGQKRGETGTKGAEKG
jgi:predicted HTH transcriptional regulator